MAFEAHLKGGAHYVLADQVGLGKTVQLGLAAKLMALVGNKPILILAPRPLLEQWQDELWSLLHFPTAVWNGRQWIDENEVVYPDMGLDGLKHCPRRAGIISTGLIKRQSECISFLLAQEYECIILDEAHHARRMNLGPLHCGEDAKPTNLLSFMRSIGRRTKSLLLATATPVQLDPIEAWDLLDILNQGNETVLGDIFSLWRKKPEEAMDIVLGRSDPPEELSEVWDWMRDPFPPSNEGISFEVIRRSLNCPQDTVLSGGLMSKLRTNDMNRLLQMRISFFQENHPFIRHIVRRTRAFLESHLDPSTNEPYLQPVRVKLYGEGDNEAIILPAFLERAYNHAEMFCHELSQRPGLNSGFLKTMLLRRVGSTIEAGRLTAEKMLGDRDDDGEEIDDDRVSLLYPLSENEKKALRAFADTLHDNKDEDPKLFEVVKKLEGGWLDLGCIIFSQYYDSALWITRKLSERWPNEMIAIYAGAGKSGILRNGAITPVKRDEIKAQVQSGQIRVLVGTDAASEGLNLQRLGTLINLDLPWNPTRLEQRKGRILRIGQLRSEVDIYNMRYKGSVEDRVHELLSQRLENIRDMFGQVPDTLEDVWVEVALAEEKSARRIIDEVPKTHPFEMRYDQVESVDWESCSTVLATECQLEKLRMGW